MKTDRNFLKDPVYSHSFFLQYDLAVKLCVQLSLIQTTLLFFLITHFCHCLLLSSFLLLQSFLQLFLIYEPSCQNCWLHEACYLFSIIYGPALSFFNHPSILFGNANFDTEHFSHLNLIILYSWNRLSFNFTHLQYVMQDEVSTYNGSRLRLIILSFLDQEILLSLSGNKF